MPSIPPGIGGRITISNGPLPIDIRIRCAVCNKPVDHIEMTVEPGFRDQTLIVRCHGAEQSMRFTLEQMAEWSVEEREFWQRVGRGEIEGVAFNSAGLLARE